MKLCLSVFLLCLQLAFGHHGTTFKVNLFRNIAADRTKENVIFSPAAIEVAVAQTLYGAEGTTAKEIRKAIGFEQETNEELAKIFGDFVAERFKGAAAANDAPSFTVANRLYVNEGVQIKPEFSRAAAQYFGGSSEQIKFADSSAALDTINAYVKQATQNKIPNALQAGAVDAAARALLVNAVYFRGPWAKPFPVAATKKADFSISAAEKVPAELMSLTESLRYGELPELDATVLLLPYANSDLDFMILLPKDVNGLQELEQKLANVDLKTLVSRTRTEKVDVTLPKFRAEYTSDLREPFAKIGLKSFFSEAAEFRNIFAEPQSFSNAIHRAYMEVNEFGCDAAADASEKPVAATARGDTEPKTFRADHPFVFAIVNDKTVFLAGHIARM